MPNHTEVKLNDDTINALQIIQTYQPPKSIAPASYHTPCQAVLLTGANGYLGVYLINELINNTDATIYCAIRGNSLDEVRQKLNDNLIRYRFSHLIDHHRLQLLIVDLALPQLDLKNDVWHQLSVELDAIYHNGAYVHHLQSFTRMAPTNFGSTIEIIRLAATKKRKRIHFVSTKYSCINCVEDIAHEGMPSIAPVHQDIAFGYTTTKWAAEWALWKAQANDIPVDIYRLGQITGDAETGISNYEKNNLTRFICGCIKMGIAPNLQNQHEMIPVNYVAKSIVALSLQEYQKANGWNIVNNNQITHGDIFKIMQKLGHTLDIIDNTKWRKALRKVGNDNPLFPLIAYYDNEESINFIRTENQQTMAALHKAGVDIPEDYQQLFKRYIHYWKEKGLVN